MQVSYEELVGDDVAHDILGTEPAPKHVIDKYCDEKSIPIALQSIGRHARLRWHFKKSRESLNATIHETLDTPKYNNLKN